jgi:hypothetical protein
MKNYIKGEVKAREYIENISVQENIGRQTIYLAYTVGYNEAMKEQENLQNAYNDLMHRLKLFMVDPDRFEKSIKEKHGL